MGITWDWVRNNIGIALVLLSGALMSFTMLSADPVGAAICGEECARGTIALSLMPAYFAMMVIGIGNSATPYIKYLVKREFNRRDLKRLFLGLVISGGSVLRREGKYCIRYYGKDGGMHSVFRDLAHQIYGTEPQTVKVNGRGTWMSQFYSKHAVLEMAELSPGLASRKGETPTISYILDGGKSIRIEAVRVMMSTAGWINCTFSYTSGSTKAYPRLGFGSVLSDSLAGECSCLMMAIPLRMESYSNSKYPSKGYLATSDVEEMQNFLKAGGFLRGSRVKKGTFGGMEKNILLQALLGVHGTEFRSREAAIDLLTSRDDASLELSIYLDRLRLG